MLSLSEINVFSWEALASKSGCLTMNKPKGKKEDC